jgi:hypothetical protein
MLRGDLGITVDAFFCGAEIVSLEVVSWRVLK